MMIDGQMMMIERDRRGCIKNPRSDTNGGGEAEVTELNSTMMIDGLY
jgi:hypothetical protein